MLIAGAVIIVPSSCSWFISKEKNYPSSVGTFSTNTLLFTVLLFRTILIIGALTFSPAQVLGPIIEQFLHSQDRHFENTKCLIENYSLSCLKRRMSYACT